MLAELMRVEEDVGKIHVPLGYSESHCHLRTHIRFVRHLLKSDSGRMGPEAPTKAPPAG
jgi:hypothetical protein